MNSKDNSNYNSVFQGVIVKASTRLVTLPNNVQMQMDVVEHPGGAAIAALNEKQEICLLKQYRAVFDRWFWELPAGKRDFGEAPRLTAERELTEEAGVKAAQWHDLGSMVSSPGVFTEEVFLYLATNLTAAETDIGDDEIISEIQWLKIDKAVQWAQDGTINDAKSVIGILRAASWISEVK